MNSEELVRAAYHVLLGRAPENEQVVQEKLRTASSAQALLELFNGSAEYQARINSFSSMLSAGQSRPAAKIDVRVSQHTLGRLFSRTKAQWESLGKNDPYWSVLTHSKFRKENIHKHLKEFEQSGLTGIEGLDQALDRGAMELPHGCCLELGCGVGRLTRYLAPRFERVIGVDISSGNLEICRDYLNLSGITNVDLIHITEVEDLKALPEIDFLFSMIVLQHNPPPVMKYFLDSLLGKVRAGGGAYFQIPTHTPGYSFDVMSYLDSDEAILDMHVLPMFEVFDSLSRARFQPREVLMDTSTGMYGSHRFLAKRQKTL